MPIIRPRDHTVVDELPPAEIEQLVEAGLLPGHFATDELGNLIFLLDEQREEENEP